MRMGRRIAKTLRRTALHAGPTVLGIVVLDFLFLQLMPGDAADVMATQAGAATAETMAMLRERFGLDQPVLTQLGNFLGHLLQGNLGYSPRFNASVFDDFLAGRQPVFGKRTRLTAGPEWRGVV